MSREIGRFDWELQKAEKTTSFYVGSQVNRAINSAIVAIKDYGLREERVLRNLRLENMGVIVRVFSSDHPDFSIGVPLTPEFGVDHSYCLRVDYSRAPFAFLQTRGNGMSVCRVVQLGDENMYLEEAEILRILDNLQLLLEDPGAKLVLENNWGRHIGETVPVKTPLLTQGLRREECWMGSCQKSLRTFLGPDFFLHYINWGSQLRLDLLGETMITEVPQKRSDRRILGVNSPGGNGIEIAFALQPFSLKGISWRAGDGLRAELTEVAPKKRVVLRVVSEEKGEEILLVRQLDRALAFNSPLFDGLFLAEARDGMLHAQKRSGMSNQSFSGGKEGVRVEFRRGSPNRIIDADGLFKCTPDGDLEFSILDNTTERLGLRLLRGRLPPGFGSEFLMKQALFHPDKILEMAQVDPL